MTTSVNLSVPKRVQSLSLYAVRSALQDPKYQKGIELFATIASILLLAAFAIRPTLITMSRLLQDIKELKQTDQALEKKIEALSTADDTFLRMKKELVTLNTVLPDIPDVNGFVKRVEKIASEAQVYPISFTVKSVPKDVEVDITKGSIQELEATLNLEGQYENLQTFMQQLSTVDRVISFESVSYSQEKKDIDAPSIVTANIVLKTYYFGTAKNVDTTVKPSANQDQAGDL